MYKFEDDLIDLKGTENKNQNSVKVEEKKEEKVEVKNEIKPEVKQENKIEPKKEFKIEIKNEKNETNNSSKKTAIFNSDDENLRRSSLFNAESDLYRVKFDEYAGIPDCIVNEIFGLNDGKGKISIEEAIIMLMNLIPSAKAGINEAKTIQDAIYISRIKIAAFLYKECTFGFTNIPEHSRVNFSNKVKSDCERNKAFDVLYDYQLMRLSGYLPLG